VQKSPQNAAFRVTLGAVYLDAGLFLRARSELEQAAKIDPNSTTIRELLVRARKMAS
jgi:Flp pilus assembly protein TadD